MQYAVNFTEVLAPVAPKVAKQRRSRNVCIGFRGVYLIAKRNSRRKTSSAEYSQQRCYFNIHTEFSSDWSSKADFSTLRWFMAVLL